MRIATWNVNSLAARLIKVAWWLERAQPDILLMQETKLGDADAPRDEFARLDVEIEPAQDGLQAEALHQFADVDHRWPREVISAAAP